MGVELNYIIFKCREGPYYFARVPILVVGFLHIYRNLWSRSPPQSPIFQLEPRLSLQKGNPELGPRSARSRLFLDKVDSNEYV